MGTPLPAWNFSSCGILPCNSATDSRGGGCGHRRAAAIHRAVALRGQPRPGACQRHGRGPAPGTAQIGDAQLHGQHRQQGRHGADAIHPHPAREHPRKGPLDVRISAGAPGETGPPHAARQFGQQPERGEGGGLPAPAARKAVAQMHEHRRRGRVVTAQEGCQRQHRQCGQRRRQAAVGVHGNEQPPEGAREPGRGEGGAETGPPPAPRAHSRTRAKAASEASCSHQSGSPPQGQAMEAACASPASTAAVNRSAAGARGRPLP